MHSIVHVPVENGYGYDPYFLGAGRGGIFAGPLLKSAGWARHLRPVRQAAAHGRWPEHRDDALYMLAVSVQYRLYRIAGRFDQAFECSKAGRPEPDREPAGPRGEHLFCERGRAPFSMDRALEYIVDPEKYDRRAEWERAAILPAAWNVDEEYADAVADGWVAAGMRPPEPAWSPRAGDTRSRAALRAVRESCRGSTAVRADPAALASALEGRGATHLLLNRRTFRRYYLHFGPHPNDNLLNNALVFEMPGLPDVRAIISDLVPDSEICAVDSSRARHVNGPKITTVYTESPECATPFFATSNYYSYSAEPGACAVFRVDGRSVA